jgi:phosphomannomutase
LKRPVKAVFDCSNGTAGIVLEKLLKTYKLINLKLINSQADGRFPAHGPDPMQPRAMNDLSKAVLKNQADLGAIFDADADRAFFVDDRGRPVHPDASAALMSKNFRGPAVLDVRSGYLARESLSADKKKIFESRVGTYFMKKLMKEKNADFGAEISGHYYFWLNHRAVFDSGILAAIQMLNQVSGLMSQDLSLSQWIDNWPKYYRSGELNFRVGNKESIFKNAEKKYAGQARKISYLDGLKMEFKDWWFNLRPSNTEDLVRLNLETKEKKNFQKQLKNLKNFLVLK